jgi:flagellar hook protein FlgE
MARKKPIYENIVNNNIVCENDNGLQERIKNLPTVCDIVDIIKNNTNYTVEKYYKKCHRTDGKIILNTNGESISLLLKYLKNSGDKNKNKRWQVYPDIDIEKDMTNYLLGVYSTGDNYVFTLSDDDVFIRNYIKNPSRGGFSSSWVDFNLLKNSLYDDIVIGANKVKDNLGRMRIIFKKNYFSDAISTIVKAKFNDNYTNTVKKTENILDFYSIDYEQHSLEKHTINNKPKRNQLFIKMALEQSNYKCEACSDHFSFIKPDNNMYTEGHHLLPINNKAQKDFDIFLDHPNNIFSLCPNCHRKIHHAKEIDKRSLIDILYSKRFDTYKDIFSISNTDIYKYY